VKITTFDKSIFDTPQGRNSLVHDYQTLGIRSYIAPQRLSWILKKTDGGIRNIQEMTKKVMIGGRITYNSATPLKIVQNKLGAMLLSEQERLPMDHVWSYRPNVDFYKELSDFTGAQYLVQFDIRKYFDTIPITKIVDVLTQEEHGFSKEGATLIARYLTVRRKSHIGNFFDNTLQQGSPASPVMSNIVGYHLFDKPLLAMCAQLELDNPRLKMRYRRYCDNIFVFVDGEIPLAAIQDFKEAVHTTVVGAKFRYHQWSVTPNNHPKRNQKVLGVVLNDKTRLEKSKYTKLRSTLFNSCTLGKSIAIDKFFVENPIFMSPSTPTPLIIEIYAKKFDMIMQGRVSNMCSASSILGLQTKKLFKASKVLSGKLGSTHKSLLPTEIFKALSSYKDASITLDKYLENLTNACIDVEETEREKWKATQAQTQVNYRALKNKQLSMGNYSTNTTTSYGA